MTRKIRDNGAKASIHFAKAEQIAFYHNSREAFIPETSNEELRQKNECDRTAEEARALFEELSAQADENFLKNTGRRTNMKGENKLWESVMNLRGRHTLEDVQRVNARIQKITGFIPVQTSLHRDEGHTDEKTGDFIQNVHAQTLWITQNPEDGKSMAYLLFGRKDIYRQIQDIVAEELGMTRGQSAEITGAKHFKNMRDFKQMKRAERAQNKEWEAKLEANNKAWQEKQAAWEAKLAEREAKREEWERKLPEIMEARERRSKFMSDKIDWEQIRESGRYRLAFIQMGNDIAGWPNPQGNFLLEAQKDAIRSIFYIFGSVTQLAVFIAKKTWENDEKIKNEVDIFKVRENLNRAVAIIANDCGQNPSELQDKIYRILKQIPEHKQHELFDYAIQHAPNDEIKNDIRALIEGRFSDIAKSEQAQRRIENRDLRQALREYSEELKRIKEELREMDEENRVLNLAERAILREKGATRDEYAEQEAENRKRLDELKTLKDEQKAIKKAIDEQKQPEQKDAQTIRELTEQIAELNKKIAEITAENAKKQKELEQEKAKRIITPQQLDKAERRISELEDKIKEQEFVFYGKADEIEAAEFEKDLEKQIVAPQTLDPFSIIDELEPEQKQPEPVKPEPEPIREEPKIEQKPEPKPEQKQPEPVKPEPEPIAKKADDNLNIYGYPRSNVEPRRRLDEYPRERKIDDRPKYEPEPVKIEPEKPREEPKDPWAEIEESIEKWKKEDSESEKSLMGRGLRLKLNEYEKQNGGKMSEERQNTINRYRFWLSYDPIEAEREAQKNAETMQKIAAMNREREQKRQQTVEIETAIKYDDVRGKNVKQEDETRQRTLKKRKDELEMGR